jgi:hypothetical protein
MRSAMEGGERVGRRLAPPRSGALLEDIADAAHGMDELFVEGVINLGAKSAHVNFDDVRVALEIDVPHLLRDEGPGEHLTAALQEER